MPRSRERTGGGGGWSTTREYPAILLALPHLPLGPDSRAKRAAVGMPGFHVVTVGCQMNQHDSERMAEVLRRAGYAEAESVADADVVLLNTCSVREKAEQKMRSEVGRLAILKRERPGLI